MNAAVTIRIVEPSIAASTDDARYDRQDGLDQPSAAVVAGREARTAA